MTALMGNAVEKPAKTREPRSQTRTSLALCPVDRSGAARRELRKAAGGGGTWRLFVATIFQPAGDHCSGSGLSLSYDTICSTLPSLMASERVRGLAAACLADEAGNAHVG